MKTLSMKSVSGILLGIVVCLLLYAFVTKSPYIFGIGLTIGILLSDVHTVRQGAISSAIISAAVGFYLILSDFFAAETSKDTLLGFIQLLLIVGFGSFYGATLVWIKNRLEEGTRLFF